MTYRLRRFKRAKTQLTPCGWAFFLARNGADLEAAMELDGAEFWFLYYLDRWREAYREHRQLIEHEWQKRFTPEELVKHKEFILRSHYDRPPLPHDDISRSAKAAAAQRKAAEMARRKSDAASTI